MTPHGAPSMEAGQSADAGIGGSVEQNVDPTYSMTISRDRDGTTVKVTDTANADEADPPNPQFMQAMDLGGGRTMHVRAMEADGDGDVEEESLLHQSEFTTLVASNAPVWSRLTIKGGVIPPPASLAFGPHPPFMRPLAWMPTRKLRAS